MHDAASTFFAPWANFYVIAGSSSAALTGLVFVVVTLVSSMNARPSREGLATFTTPTIVHFCAAFLISTIMSAPWRLLIHPGVILAFEGLAGFFYVAALVRRTRLQTAYDPDIEDWLWYAFLPLLAYISLVAWSVLLQRAPVQTLFGIAATDVLLIFMGIHNAWDVVTYLAFQQEENA